MADGWKPRTTSALALVNSLLEEKEPPGRTQLEGLDRAINQALPISTSFDSSLNRGDIIEIQGPSGSGKTELLYFIAMVTLLPREAVIPSLQRISTSGHLTIGGRGKSVIVCDCDGKWSITRLHSNMAAFLRQKLAYNFPEATFNEETVVLDMEAIIASSLRHLHVFRPSSSASLAATLTTLPEYHYEKMPDEEICMLMVDEGLSSFYWQDLWDRQSIPKDDPLRGRKTSSTDAVVRALRNIQQSHGPIIFLTTWALMRVPNTPYFFRQHLPPPFPSPFDGGREESSISLTHHITLVDPNQHLIPDSIELPDGEAQWEEAKPLVVQAIMRTPPRDGLECIVTYFSFLIGKNGVSDIPIEGLHSSTPIDTPAPEHQM